MKNSIENQERLYHTMHWCCPEYRNNNMGLSFLKYFPDEIWNMRKVIELGCGNGQLCQELANRGMAVTGVDITPGPHERTKDYRFCLYDINDVPIPYQRNEFALCMAFDLLEHLVKETVLALLPEMSRIAENILYSVASYGNPPLHLTVESPGWWLDTVIELCPEKSWQLLKIEERHKDKREGLYGSLFYGRKEPKT